jgi:hypothetical protein
MAMELILHREFNVIDDSHGVEKIDIRLLDGRSYTLRCSAVKGEQVLILSQLSGSQAYLVFCPLSKDSVLIQTEEAVER